MGTNNVNNVRKGVSHPFSPTTLLSALCPLLCRMIIKYKDWGYMSNVDFGWKHFFAVNELETKHNLKQFQLSQYSIHKFLLRANVNKTYYQDFEFFVLDITDIFTLKNPCQVLLSTFLDNALNLIEIFKVLKCQIQSKEFSYFWLSID